ncbi:MAG: polymer-forming cytoskeletal protein [Thermodesulfovibrionales bacterium]|nr:polymer-forming cytoskeletal protein [Thermodesulfovibrionales bacterium]
MFTKNTEKLESFIGANSAFKGNIETKGTLRIDGKLEGNVQADWVILGEKSSVKGDITARGIIVGGSVEGNLRAKEIIEIKSKGRVTGDTVTTKLTMSEGGIFDGRSTMVKDESKVLEFQSKV